MAMTKRQKFEITTEKLFEIFDYKKDLGKLFWKKKISNKTRIGEQVGGIVFCHGNPYLACSVLKNKFLVHRLIWWMEHGYPPKNQIDHIDGNGLNNHISNLRDVTIQEQAKNLSRRITNTSGVTGVSWCKKARGWIAQINVGNENIYLGCFTDKAFEEAVKVRKEAEKKYGFHKNHDRVK